MTIRSFKMLGFLLAYPETELVKHYGDMVKVLREEKILGDKQIKDIEKLILHLSTTNLLDIQEEYVALFDRTPSLSLHLFEHVHGEGNERGQAMVDLQSLYLEEGLEIDARETPDYLPMFLEYLAILPFEEAQQCLAEVINVLSVIGKRLKGRKSAYATIFNVLEKISKAKPDMELINQALKDADGHASTNDELDKEWEDQPAFDNANVSDGSGCPMAQGAVDRMLEGIDKEGKSNG